MTNEQRQFMRTLQDVQARYELLLQGERERSDKYAAAIAQRDQRIARLSDRLHATKQQLEAREKQLQASAQRCTKLAGELARWKKTQASAASEDEVARRFWRHVTITPTGCWEWQGSWSTKDRAGRMQIDGVQHRAPRIAFRVTGRWCPPRLTRSCDTSSCVNPEHWLPVGANRNSTALGRTNLDGRRAPQRTGGEV